MIALMIAERRQLLGQFYVFFFFFIADKIRTESLSTLRKIDFWFLINRLKLDCIDWLYLKNEIPFRGSK